MPNINVATAYDGMEFASGKTSCITRMQSTGPWKILIVDDEPEVHTATRFAFRNFSFNGRGIEIFSAYSAAEGFDTLKRESDIALVLLDVVMESENAGLHLVKRIRGELNNHLIRIILRTGQPGTGLESKIIVEFDINDFKSKAELTQQTLFTMLVASLRSYESLASLEYMYGQINRAQEATVIALANLAESRDTDTGGHVNRVCRLTATIAARLHASGECTEEISDRFLAQVGLAAILHDIGKVAIPDAILLKPGKHTPEERAVMETHAMIGEDVLTRAANMVEGESYLSIGAQIAGGHHEHFDGNGYPRRLVGSKIPLAARIVAVVDVFDALLQRRPYKEPWPLPRVLDYLQTRKGRQFDPEVVDALIDFVTSENPDWLLEVEA